MVHNDDVQNALSSAQPVPPEETAEYDAQPRGSSEAQGPAKISGKGRRRWNKAWIGAGIFTVFVGIGFALALIPVPYVIQSPGPTIDVLGTQGGTQILEVSQSGAQSYFAQHEGSTDLPAVRGHGDDDGQLRMVTVSELGGPGSKVRGIDWLRAQFDASSTIKRFSDVYDSSVTAEDIRQASSAQMESSHSSSAIAAAEYLGIPMDSTLTIVGAAPGSGAEGLVEDGDILLAMELPDGTEEVVDVPSVPFRVMKTVEPGSTVKLRVLRDGQEIVVPVVTTATAVNPGQVAPPGSKLGIYLTADTAMPVAVDFHLERVGGPSAGLIFALGIIDQLGDHPLPGGQIIAGTGALSFSGDVIPIGGVRQKMYGALRDGADWFLVPQENCDEVVGNEPAGLRVIPVETLADGVQAVDAIAAGQGNSLPSCPVG